MLKVLYEDNHLIAVYKPAGILVQADETGDQCLMDEVKDYLKNKYQKPGNVFLGLIHRLDRPTAGIVLFGKTSKGAARLSEQFRDHQVEKNYEAVVVGKMPQKFGELKNYLKKDHQTNIVSIAKKNEVGAQEAILEYEVLAEKNNYSHLKIKLVTGRSHQIRVQLAALSYPIVGDVKYGGSAVSSLKGVIALCATEMKFKLATKEELRKIKIDFPYGGLF